MTQAVTRLFDDHDDAVQAVRELKAAGVSDDNISLIANNAHGRHGRDGDDESEAAEGAAEGAATGGLIGGGAGLAAGLGMLAIPGLGPVVAAGWLVSTVAGAAAGALAGAATGGLLGALKDAGHSDEEANVYAEGVRRGGTLVSVRADSETERLAAERVLHAGRGVDALQRGQAYREAGWARFDAAAPAYTAEEVEAERRTWTERRSFASDGDRFTGRADDIDPRQDPDSNDPDRIRDRPIDPTLRGV